MVVGSSPTRPTKNPAIIRGFAAVAQLDRVLGYEPRGRGFNSCQPHQNIVLDQRVSSKRASPFFFAAGLLRDSELIISFRGSSPCASFPHRNLEKATLTSPPNSRLFKTIGTVAFRQARRGTRRSNEEVEEQVPLRAAVDVELDCSNPVLV